MSLTSYQFNEFLSSSKFFEIINKRIVVEKRSLPRFEYLIHNHKGIYYWEAEHLINESKIYSILYAYLKKNTGRPETFYLHNQNLTDPNTILNEYFDIDDKISAV